MEWITRDNRRAHATFSKLIRFSLVLRPRDNDYPQTRIPALATVEQVMSHALPLMGEGQAVYDGLFNMQQSPHQPARDG